MTSPTVDRRQGLVGNTPMKAPVACATTGNITLSGEQVIDGFQTNASRVLVFNQTDPTQNGIYDSSSAAWTRSADADGNYDLVSGTLVYVLVGTLYGRTFFNVTSPDPITIDTTALTWARAFITSSDQFSQTLPFQIGTVGFKLQRDGISATDAPFNAKGDGVTFDSVAINAAIARAVATGQKWVYLGPGNYVLDPAVPLNITAGVALIGAGRGCTTISWSSTTMIALNIATVDQCIVRGILFAAPLNCTAGGAIALNGSGGVANAFSQITECEFSNGFAQIATTTAFAVTIRGNYLSGAVSSAIQIANTVNPDAGDSIVDDNTISNLGASAIGIIQASSGGLRIQNNKILGGTQGIALNLAAGDATSILMVHGNSIEMSTAAAITLLVGSGATFALVSIEGNILSQVPIGINIPGNGGTDRLSNLTIGGGSISLTASGTNGIIVNDVANFTIYPVTIIGNGGTPVGIITGGFSVQGRIYPGSIQGCATKVQNGSGTTVIVAEDTQTGVEGVTCSTARGSLWYGTGAVSFAIAFDSTPSVTCDPGSVAGGISAWASSVTSTGFTMNAISVSSGSTGNTNFRATGVL